MNPSQKPAPEASGGRAGEADHVSPVTVVLGAMVGALVVLAFVLAMIGAEPVTPPTWMLVVVCAATLVSWLLVLALPVRRAQGASVETVVQQHVVLRAAVLEAPALLGVFLAFVADPTNLFAYVVPAVFSIVGMVLLARPSMVRGKVTRAP